MDRAGPYTPTLILHGGAGAPTRANLPPKLYALYETSLKSYLKSTHDLLVGNEHSKPATALDAACHAVALMEDNPLFNCGRGSVFTVKGEIEMEASVAVATVRDLTGGEELRGGFLKKSAAVSMVKNTRHPIMLAREVLFMGEGKDGGESTHLPRVDEMHGHISGEDVEKWGWERGLERKGPKWFWTPWRWEEHKQGLRKAEGSCGYEPALREQPESVDEDHSSQDVDRSEFEQLWSNIVEVNELPTQGTVGCVCLDSWGNVAAATSTGGLTNKGSGRIGDTPTVGAGFWAESWQEPPITTHASTNSTERSLDKRQAPDVMTSLMRELRSLVVQCMAPNSHRPSASTDQPPPYSESQNSAGPKEKPSLPRRRAIAMSGTGNGDSFLRTCATRTTGSICRFSGKSLSAAIKAVSGPGGELEKSAGDRWERTGEGQGGTIGIEVYSDSKVGKVCFDFNCNGMWRAYYDENGKPKIMVFREQY